MPTPSIFKRAMPRLLILLTLLIAPLRLVYAEETITLAIYQFRPENIAAMGFESDVMLAIRNAMGNRPRVDLLAKRDMEDVLSRRDIAQDFSLSAAVRGGRLLSVRYVLVGSVNKAGGQINASLMLVDVSLGQEIGSWNTVYRTRNEINKTAASLVAGIVAATESAATLGNAAAMAINTPLPVVLPTGNLTAQAKRSGIQLSWQKIPGIEILGYNIYRSQTAAGPFSFLGTTDGTGYVDRSAATGVTYYYQVGEVNIEGLENRGTQTAQAMLKDVSGSTSINPPLIYSLTPLAGGARLQIVASLVDGSAPVAKFRVYRARDDKDWKVIGQVPVRATGRQASRKEILRHPFNDTRLPGGGSYRYAVSAVAADGAESAFSESFDFTRAMLPTLVAAQQGLLRGGHVRWKASSVGLGYRLYRREAGRNWIQLSEIKGLQTTSYTDTDGLQDGMQYDYSYSVFDDISESRKSNPVEIRTKPPLPAPTAITAASGLARQISVQWQAVVDPDLKSYVIYRTDYTDTQRFEMTKVAEVESGDAQSYTDRGDTHALDDGARYLYAIASRNRLGGEGPMSLAVAAETKHAPAVVAGLAAGVKDGNILLAWEYAEEDVSEFIISRRWEGEDWQEQARVAATERKFTDTVLRPYSKAEYQLVVVDSTGLRSAAVKLEGQPSPAHVNLVVVAQSSLRRTDLGWNPQAFVDAYEIRRRRLPGGEWQLISTLSQPDAGSYVDQSGLADGVEYAYRVAPIANNRVLGESNIVSSTTKLVAAPRQLEASRGDARQITLHWPADNDEDIGGYVVYRGKGALTAEQLSPYAEVAGADAAQYVDRGSESAPLEHGADYSYSVSAKNIMGGAGPPGVVAVGSSKPLPEPVYNLVVFSEDSSVKLNWEYENPGNVAAYQVYGRESAGQWSLLSRLSGVQNSFVDQQLKPFVPLQYRLVVEDVDGLLSTQAVSQEITSPARIDLRIASDNRLRQIHLSWIHQYHIDGFTLQRRASAEQPWGDLKTLRDEDATAYIDKKGLVDGADYEYRLLVLDDTRALGESNTVRGHTKDLPTAPADVTARSGLVGEVRLSWQAENDADIGGYNIYRVDAGELKKLAAVSGADKGSYVDKGGTFDSLHHGSDYSYAVAAYNSYRVEGERSELVTATTKHLPMPVTGVSARQASGVVSLSWNPNPEDDIDYYVVARSNRSSCSNFSDIAKISAPDAVFRDREARPDSRYCYRVLAVDSDALKGGHSSVVEIVIPALVSIE